MASNVLSLADDILLEVFELLDFRALVSCQATCRRMNRIIRGSISLQYAIELGACGMVDGPRGGQTLDVTERLRRLRLYDAAWRHPRWTKAEKMAHLDGVVDISFDCNSFVFRRDRDSGHSSYVVPSALRGVDERHSDPVTYSDVAVELSVVDASQDLIVWLDDPSSCYCLRTLSTGDPHPLACNNGTIKTAQEPRHASIVDICEDFLLEAIIDLGGSEYTVWNWKTGIPEYKVSEPLDSGYKVKRFFDPEHVLVEANGRTGSPIPVGLHILRFRLQPSNPEYLPDSVTARPSYCFAFPEFIQRHGTQISIKAAPWRTANLRDPGHFYSNPNDRLFSVGVVWAADERIHQLHFYIPSTTFYSYMKSHPMTGTSVPIHVPWDAWGRMGSLATPLMGRHSIRRPLCMGGMRGMYYSSDDATTLKATILDFHPLRVARAAMLQRDGDIDITILRVAPLRGAHVGDEDFETLLPCIATKIPPPDESMDEHSSWRMDRMYLCDNGIVCMQLEEWTRRVAHTWVYSV
ncbi:hypothetical protein BV25DRAFT_1825297 [Artomyces pyxidatus]|uniref:Uncharacterized protein n=1 Tax=Artomyces pyxidatus TaxID=48021 RepID=A0ACB8T1U7_9AGAM|nr:hypothetical protein BV25DRAFT_1825297 [Artomyces pyxidatus]